MEAVKAPLELTVGEVAARFPSLVDRMVLVQLLVLVRQLREQGLCFLLSVIWLVRIGLHARNAHARAICTGEGAFIGIC